MAAPGTTTADVLRVAAAAIPLFEWFRSLIEQLLSRVAGKGTALTVLTYVVCGLMVLPLALRLIGTVRGARHPKIKNVDALDAVVGKRGELPGRKLDLENLIGELQDVSLVFLVGESGVGKSTLLKLGVAEELEEHSALLPVLIENQRWFETPEAAFRGALERALRRRSKAPAESPAGERRPLAEIVTEIRAATRRTPVILLDQFESYIDRNRRDLLTDTKAWLSPDELQARIPFWAELADLLKRDRVRVLIALRSDYGQVVSTFQVAPSRVSPVSRLEKTVLQSRLNQIEQAHFVDDAANPQWSALRDALEESFLEMGGFVLPIQVELALRGLPYLRPLTVAEYRRRGAISGLEARVVLSRVEAVASEQRLSTFALLGMLKLLYNPAASVATPQTAVTLASSMGLEHTDTGRMETVLRRLQELRLLRAQIGEQPHDQVWSLTHSYLYYAVMRAERDLLAKNITLAQREKQLRTGVTWYQRWRALLWPHELIAASWNWLRGRNDAGVYRGLLGWSTLKFVPFLLLFATPFLLADAFTWMPYGSTLRGWMNAANVSFFRTLFSSEDILRKTDADIVAVVARLRAQRAPNGWYRINFDRQFDFPDYWNHAQVTAQLSHPSATEEEANLVGAFDDLARLHAAVKRDATGSPIGWPQSAAPNSFARAETALWFGIGLARLLAQQDRLSTEQKALLERMQADLQLICARHFLPVTGGWNRFANQVQADSRASSTYVSGLALLMLEEFRKAGADFSIGALKLADLQRRTVGWLQKTCNCKPGWFVWRDMPSDHTHEFWEGAAMQIHYALLTTGGSDRDLGQDLVVHLSEGIRADVGGEGEYHMKLQARGIDGSETMTEGQIRFNYHPWFVAASAGVFQQRCTLHLGSVDLANVRQAMGAPISGQDSGAMTKAGDFVYIVTEWLYALQQMSDSLHDTSTCSG